MPKSGAESLLEIMRGRAESAPDQVAFTYLEGGETNELTMTYRELDERARAIAAHLQSAGLEGERALLLYPPGLDFVTAFYGCLSAGTIAVPAYPPDPTRLDRTLPRVKAIIEDCAAKVVLTTAVIKQMAGFMFPEGDSLADLEWLASDELAKGSSESWKMPAQSDDTIIFLQYTSGSTGSPRGVTICNDNLMANQHQMQETSDSSEDTTVFSWVPFYHDLGLIGGVVHPVYVGGRSVIMSPMDFLQKPARWLQAISRHRATFSAGPNFAFELCTRRMTAEDCEGLDLDSWLMALVGAEPISAQTLENFTAKFAPHGFRETSFFQGYGLAETVLSVSAGKIGEMHKTAKLNKSDLRNNVVTLAGEDAPGAAFGAAVVEIVSCGRALDQQEILVVDSETCEQKPDGSIGEVWVRGKNVARGYWNRDEETAETFGASLANGEGPYLRTGDLGFMHEEELYVTGRVKDLIILRGRNIYPQDLEARVAAAHPVLKPGCSAAFSVDLASGEGLVVVQEVRPGDLEEGETVQDVIAAIRRSLLREEGVRAHGVVLIKNRTIPKTSSGKIQRRASREAYLGGTLEVVASDVVDERDDEAPSSLISLEQLVAHDPEAREDVLLASLRETLAEALDAASGDIDMDAPLNDTGLDSVAILNLTHDVESQLSVPLEIDLLLEGASGRSIAQHILNETEGAYADA